MKSLDVRPLAKVAGLEGGSVRCLHGCTLGYQGDE
jgi:hypothetical protein